MSRYLLQVVVLSVACLILTQRTQAQDYPEVFFILDASGSMDDDVGGQRKIDVAKEVMGEIVPNLAPEVRVGLTAYGHRRKGDCTDIEVLVPAGSTDRDALLREVNSLQPKGKTPIASAILAVAGQVRTNDVDTAIVLVSDGLETCGGDPCKVARELKATGARLVIHTVGFDVDADTAEQLTCISNATGGKYFAARDSDTLLQALQSVADDVTQKVVQAKTKAVNGKTGLGKLRISMPPGSEKSLSFVQIVRLWDGAVLRRIESPKPVASTPLPAGKYAITMGFATPNYGAPTVTNVIQMTIRNGETRELRLGSISFNIPKHLVKNDWQNRLNVDKVILTASGTEQPVVTVLDRNNGAYNFAPKPIVPGLYDVRFKYATDTDVSTVVARGVQVAAGKDVLVTLDSGIQFQHADVDITGWDLIAEGSATTSPPEDGDAPIVRVPVLSVRSFSPVSGGASCLWYPYVIPPGRYDIVVHVKGMVEPLPVGEDIDIGQGELLRFDSGF